MLIPVRLRKILRDLWSSKTRTVLIVLTIAIGAFAVGTIARTWVILSRELDQAYFGANPASIILSTDRAFHDDLVDAIQKMPAVADAQGRYRMDVQVETGPDDWRSLQLTALVPNADPSAIVKAWEASGQFRDVTAEMGTQRDQVVIKARVVRLAKKTASRTHRDG